jgi:hypothetical protein
MKPLPIPNPTAYSAKKTWTYKVNVDNNVRPTAKIPPIRITAREPIAVDSLMPIGKNSVLNITIIGSPI